MTGEDAFLNELAELRRRFSVHRYFAPKAASLNSCPIPEGRKYYELDLDQDNDWWVNLFREECFGDARAKCCKEHGITSGMIEALAKRLGRVPTPVELDELCPFKHGCSDRHEHTPFRLLRCYTCGKEHTSFLNANLQYFGGFISFFEWKEGSKPTHFHKKIGEVADLPWNYLEMDKGSGTFEWKQTVLCRILPRIFEEWRETVERIKYPHPKYGQYRESYDELNDAHCVTDGEMSFFIFAWRFWRQSHKKEGRDLQSLIEISALPLVSAQRDTINRLEGVREKFAGLVKDPASPLSLIFLEEGGSLSLKSAIGIPQEMAIEGLAKFGDKGVAFSSRFVNLIDYVLQSRFIDKHGGDRISLEREELRRVLTEIEKQGIPVGYGAEIPEGVFERVFETLLNVIAALFPENEQGTDPEAKCRFPLLLYLLWRSQSPIPVCHVWFPITNQSIQPVDGDWVQKYKDEGGDCVSVFAQVQIGEERGRLSAKALRQNVPEDMQDLCRLIRRHQIYMQVFALPVIDSAVFGQNIDPHWVQLNLKLEAKVLIFATIYHDLTRRYFGKVHPPVIKDLIENKLAYLRALVSEEPPPTTNSTPLILQEALDALWKNVSLSGRYDYIKRSKGFSLDFGQRASATVSVKSPGAVFSVFENLWANACKGKVNADTIEISCEDDSVIVKDDGGGFDEFIEGRPFEDKIADWANGKFSAEDEKDEHRGLGLYIVHRAIAFLGWNISLKRMGKVIIKDKDGTDKTKVKCAWVISGLDWKE